MKGERALYTVPELVKILGLSTENQVRNRIEAIRDLLAGDIRRGPNNQILISEQGLSLLRSLQALCETGHTLKQASNILRYQAEREEESFAEEPDDTERKREKQDETGWRALVEHLAAQVRSLEQRLAALEARRPREERPWWLNGPWGE